MANEEPRPFTGRTFQQLLGDYKDRLSIQTPSDLLILLIYCMPVYGAFRVCIEAKIFEMLASASPLGLTISEISTKVVVPGATTDPPSALAREEYLARMLRAVAGLNFVDELPATGAYAANELTRAMADEGFSKGFEFCFDTTFGPRSSAFGMVEWSRSSGYVAPEVSTDGPYQRARGIVGTTTFADWGKDESILNLSAFMRRIQRDRLNWCEWFPEEVLFEGFEPGGVFMVDVGGGFGHDLSGMAGRYGDRDMRLVLQDQPDVLWNITAGTLDGRIEVVEHDFFQPQPVKGANIYFMHKIMHDWPEKDCVKILSHLRDAMGPQSRIFINDVILPEQRGPLLFAAFDLMMFTMLSAKERTETMWKRLVAQVDGLTIKKIWQAPQLRGEGIVEIGWTT